MSDLYVEALTDDMSADAVTFASLQLPLAQRIFLALPPDARGRASCVCRAWRDVLAETALWTSLDMSGVRAVTGAEWQRFAVDLSCCTARLVARAASSFCWTSRSTTLRLKCFCRC
jgi:hypothetical protein